MRNGTKQARCDSMPPEIEKKCSESTSTMREVEIQDKESLCFVVPLWNIYTEPNAELQLEKQEVRYEFSNLKMNHESPADETDLLTAVA